MRIKQRKQDDTHHEENASISTRKKNKKTRRRSIRSPHHTYAGAAASSQLGFQPAQLVPLGVTLVGVGGDGTNFGGHELLDPTTTDSASLSTRC